MKPINLRNILLAAAAISIAAGPIVELASAPACAQQKTTTARKRKSSSPVKKGKAASSAKKNETSADVKRRQEATQKEIRQTEAQIKENERSVRTGLNELGKLGGDISAAKGRIAATYNQINSLTGQISGLEKNITTNEAELKKMREEYLKALKKMRLSRKKNSGLAFIFASENFNQALRRMRYLKQFSEWKDRQSAAIGSKNEQLKKERTNLGKAKTEYDAALKRQKAEQSALSKQYARQDALVADLKKNGTALKTHLSKKQAEANDLRNRIASLIAEEERHAAEERARREAAERKAEEERRAREEAERKADIAAEKAAEEAARREAEEKAASRESSADGGKVASGSSSKSGEKKNDKAEKERLEAEKKREKEALKKAEKQKKKEEKERKRRQKNSGSKNAPKETPKTAPKEYADARKRTPRSNTESSRSSAASIGSGNFGGMKGSLPKPVSGAFKVTSRFGRQSLPDLPDVVYDNPGIDAEVSAGASALAVYGGKVSGVYMLPGFNTVVIVNHGNYYTVYGNIAAAAVKVGDKVNAGQGLGRLAPDEDDSSRSSIHFEVWRNREKLNPLDWIR